MERTDFIDACHKLRSASQSLAAMTAEAKNSALQAVRTALQARRSDILQANAADVATARERGMSEALIDRLSLDGKKIDGMTSAIDAIIQQRDPIGEEITGWRTPQGMSIRQVRVPLGVVAIIYESRPNVTADAFALAYKSGNAVLLRGSASAAHSNRAIVDAIHAGLRDAGDGVMADSVLLCPSAAGDHSDVDMILSAVGMIDVVVPRGGKALIENVVRHSQIPAIETGSGVCHLYVDESADADMATNIARNAKMSRPSVCNAIECILVHRTRIADFLPILARAFGGKVEMRCDKECMEVLRGDSMARAAAEADWGHEFLDLVCAVHAVGSIDEAIEFINRHGTGHSECIVTESRAAARTFQSRVDASCVYVNASTRFTDGGEFGFGAELGISTQKLHARGPMGITALTTTKYLIDGDGQVRE